MLMRIKFNNTECFSIMADDAGKPFGPYRPVLIRDRKLPGEDPVLLLGHKQCCSYRLTVPKPHPFGIPFRRTGPVPQQVGNNRTIYGYRLRGGSCSHTSRRCCIDRCSPGTESDASKNHKTEDPFHTLLCLLSKMIKVVTIIRFWNLATSSGLTGAGERALMRQVSGVAIRRKTRSVSVLKNYNGISQGDPE
jgi:hypothetical protein